MIPQNRLIILYKAVFCWPLDFNTVGASKKKKKNHGSDFREFCKEHSAILWQWGTAWVIAPPPLAARAPGKFFQAWNGKVFGLLWKSRNNHTNHMYGWTASIRRKRFIGRDEGRFRFHSKFTISLFFFFLAHSVIRAMDSGGKGGTCWEIVTVPSHQGDGEASHLETLSILLND